MKKIIIIAMLFTSLVARAQEKIGSYTSSFFNPVKTEFDVRATQPKNDKFRYYISVWGENPTDKVNLILSSENAEKFVEAMQICMGEKTKSTGEMRGGRGRIVSAGARYGERRRFFKDKTKSTF